MRFDTVFDVTQQGAGDAKWLLIALPVVAAAVVLTALNKRIKSIIPAVIAWILCASVLLWSVATGFNLIVASGRLKAELKKNHCEVTEGLITDIEPMPYEGHQYEKIHLAGKLFYYSDYIKSPGFHQSISHGGPLRVGQYVRIHHVGNDIARIEIGR